jgi:hypothetical protein
MTSLIKQYAQRDSRLENITLTGFIRDNGGKSASVSAQKPAYAAIDLTKSKNFCIDTKVLTLRNDSGTYLLVRIYLSSTKPPSYFQNFEFDIFIIPPTTEQWVFIEVFSNQANAENALFVGAPTTRLYGISSENAAGDYAVETGIITFKVLNNSIVLKSLSPNFSS